VQSILLSLERELFNEAGNYKSLFAVDPCNHSPNRVIPNRRNTAGEESAVQLILATISAKRPERSFRPERRGFFFLVRSCERAAPRSGGIPLRFIA
jgi:hypothetical protein